MIYIYRLIKLTFVTLVVAWTLPSIAAQEVSVAVYAEHEKYIEASGPYGVSWKLLELAAQSQQLKLVPQQGSWEAGLKRLQAEKVDLAFPSFQTPERKKWALFTLPLLPTGSAIYTLPDTPVNKLSEIDFKTAIVGVSTNSIQEGLAKKVGFENIYSTGERPQFYAMLHEKRLDYLFFATAAVNYYCMYHSDPSKRNCLKQVGESYGNKPAHALSLDTPKSRYIIDALNTGLREIKDTPEVKNLFEQYQYTQQDLKSWQTAFTSN